MNSFPLQLCLPEITDPKIIQNYFHFTPRILGAINSQPGLLCTPRNFCMKFKIFRKKQFLGTKATSEAFLGIS